jgi:hypothetical protein
MEDSVKTNVIRTFINLLNKNYSSGRRKKNQRRVDILFKKKVPNLDTSIVTVNRFRFLEGICCIATVGSQVNVCE